MTENNTSTEPEVRIEIGEMTKGEKIAFGGIVLGAVAAIGGLFVAEWREGRRRDEGYREAQADLERKQQKRVDWYNEQQNSGRNVYELKNGRYLSVERTADQAVQIL